MRINNNITAINAHRNYGVNSTSIGKNVEKLSSGYRINRAGDDAAGLAISEKMRAQIRGLQMASKNSQDAISLVQTAEGALQSAHNILQRMRELAVQSASDTNETTIDRNALQQEFAQMIKEINDTAGKTKFNDQSLIDGTFAKSLTSATMKSPDEKRVDIAWADDRIQAGSYNVTFTTIMSKASVDFVAGNSVETASFAAISTSGNLTVKFEKNDAINGEKNNGVWNVLISGGRLVAENQRTGERIDQEMAAISSKGTVKINIGGLGWINITNNGTKAVDDDTFVNLTGQFLVSEAQDERPAVYKHVAVLNEGEQVVYETGQTTLNFKNSGISMQMKDALIADINKGEVHESLVDSITVLVSKSSGKSLTIQTGANEGDNIALNLAKLDAYSLGIANSNISNRMDASVAITQVNTALNIVSTQRAALGALQNRLEYKISNLDIGAENLQAAESRIRDVDMAKEMTMFTKNNILFQASTAMLAQANALPQGVLQLLG